MSDKSMTRQKVEAAFKDGLKPDQGDFGNLIEIATNASELVSGKLDSDRLPSDISVTSVSGNGSGLTELNADNITQGTVDNGRLPSAISVTSISGNGSGLTGLDADQVTEGTLDNGRLPSVINVASISGNGSGLTGLDADQITDGTLDNGRLPSTISVASVSGNGSGLTELDADNISEGILAGKHLPGDWLDGRVRAMLDTQLMLNDAAGIWQLSFNRSRIDTDGEYVALCPVRSRSPEMVACLFKKTDGSYQLHVLNAASEDDPITVDLDSGNGSSLCYSPHKDTAYYTDSGKLYRLDDNYAPVEIPVALELDNGTVAQFEFLSHHLCLIRAVSSLDSSVELELFEFPSMTYLRTLDTDLTIDSDTWQNRGHSWNREYFALAEKSGAQVKVEVHNLHRNIKTETTVDLDQAHFPVVPSEDGHKVYIGGADGNVYGYDAKTGSETLDRDVVTGSDVAIDMLVASSDPRDLVAVVDGELYIVFVSNNSSSNSVGATGVTDVAFFGRHKRFYCISGPDAQNSHELSVYLAF